MTNFKIKKISGYKIDAPYNGKTPHESFIIPGKLLLNYYPIAFNKHELRILSYRKSNLKVSFGCVTTILTKQDLENYLLDVENPKRTALIQKIVKKEGGAKYKADNLEITRNYYITSGKQGSSVRKAYPRKEYELQEIKTIVSKLKCRGGYYSGYYLFENRLTYGTSKNDKQEVLDKINYLLGIMKTLESYDSLN